MTTPEKVPLTDPPSLAAIAAASACSHRMSTNTRSLSVVKTESPRDIEAAFTDENGVCLLSRTGVSEVSEALWEEYEAFQQRDLSDLSVLYVFLDGLYEPLRMRR